MVNYTTFDILHLSTSSTSESLITSCNKKKQFAYIKPSSVVLKQNVKDPGIIIRNSKYKHPSGVGKTQACIDQHSSIQEITELETLEKYKLHSPFDLCHVIAFHMFRVH